MAKKTINDTTHIDSTSKPGSVEQKMGSIGTLAGRAVDNVAETPGNIVRSATTIANRTKNKASRVASKVARDVAARLDPDQPKKD